MEKPSGEWHLAAATDLPDEGVAALLEEAAAAARRRGGVAAEARALDRAARLSPDRETGARRLYGAAVAAEAAGWLTYSEAMLRDAAERTTDPALRARAIARRSYLLFDRGEFDRAYTLAVEAADRAGPEEAALLLTTSGAIDVLHHRLDIPAAVGIAERAWRLEGTVTPPSLDACYRLAWNWGVSGRSEEALSVVRPCINRLDPATVVAIDVGTALLYLEDYPHAREVLERAVRRMRDAYASGSLSYALSQLAKLELRTGNLTRGYELELESQELTESLGNDVALADNLAWLGLMESMLGRAEYRSHAESGLAVAEARHDSWNAVRARAALGSGALALGEVADAASWLGSAVTMTERGGIGHPNWFRVDADLVEALVRLGDLESARHRLAGFEERAESAGSAWGLAAAARCQAFVSSDADLTEAFERALALHDLEPSRFERARTELCYGERLRRAGLRQRARELLRAALGEFERAGAQPWADRARKELAASGEHLRRREATMSEQLTPQELQIALLVADGLSNRDVGARLFLSRPPRLTVAPPAPGTTTSSSPGTG